MKLENVLILLGKFEEKTKKKSPTILAGMAIAGVIGVAYAAFKAAPRAEKVLQEHRRNMENCRQDNKEAKREVMGETVKKMIPVMAPPVIMGGATIACIIGSHSISSRRIAVLSAAYTLSESTVKNLNSKMEEMLGEKKARQIKDSIMKDKLKASSKDDQKVLENGNLLIPGDGTVLCKDLYSGRFFYSTAEKIQQAIAKCSYDIVSDMYISLNDFYAAVNSPNLPPIPLGDDLGWNIDDSQNGKLPIVLTALLTEDNKPCLCVEYDISVRDDFRNLH